MDHSSIWTLFFILFIINFAYTNKLTHFQLTPQKHHLVLFSHTSQHIKQQKIYFKIDFRTTAFIIDRQISDKIIYLDRSLKHPISNMSKLQIKNIPKQIDHQGIGIKEQVSGVVGFAKDSEFFRIVKQSLKIQDLKLQVKIYENVLQILKQKCNNPIFPPFQLEMQTDSKNLFVSIDQPSFNFVVKSHKFLNLLQKKKNPFKMTPQDLTLRISLQLLNQVQTFPIKALIMEDCLKISGSESYECDLQNEQKKGKKQNDDFGLLLFQFDPVICTDKSAIELTHQGKIDSQAYYWSHILLILLEIGMVIIFRHRHSLQRKIACFIKGRKYN